MPLPRLHLITDDTVLREESFLARAADVLDACGAAVALHLRGHSTAAHTLHELGEQLAAVALRTGAWLLVNDRVDIARAVRAQGVQLGTRSLPIADARALLGHGAWIGYSAHGALEAATAAAEGADFIVVGTIFESASHAGSVPAGVAGVEESAATAGVPVLAIGGITTTRIAEVATAGAYGVAVLGGVWRAADPRAAAIDYCATLRALYGTAKLQERSRK